MGEGREGSEDRKTAEQAHGMEEIAECAGAKTSASPLSLPLAELNKNKQVLF